MPLTLQVLAKIDRKKALVYKKRGLVDVISKGQGVEVLQLRFKAKGTAPLTALGPRPLLVLFVLMPPPSLPGRGNRDDEFQMSEKKNQCVVCQSTNNLARHYIVPRSLSTAPPCGR